jgi:hypothetical protein
MLELLSGDNATFDVCLFTCIFPFKYTISILTSISLQVHLIGGFDDASTKVEFITCWVVKFLLDFLVCHNIHEEPFNYNYSPYR